MNQKFQDALLKKNLTAPPVWMMRQAGRYHSHYQNLRKKYSFMELCKQPELAAEVARGPIQDFDFDVAILFSDLLFPLEVLGMGLEYTDAGPRLGFSLNSENIGNLIPASDAISGMAFQKQALLATRNVLPSNKSLIGFVGGFWTLYVYAVEGGHAGNLIQSKNNSALQEKFFDHLIPLLEMNIQLQLEGGAEVVMLFDTAAGEVSPLFFNSRIAPRLIGIANKFPGKLGYYSKGTQDSFYRKEFCQAPWAGFGFDHRWNLAKNLSENISPGFVQGNFDQSLLSGEESEFKKNLKVFTESLQGLTPQQRAAWVCGLGHGVLPKTPERNVKLFVESIRQAFS